MKLKMVIATLVCGMAFCSSDCYGFDLLDRMLGRSGCGGCCASSCGDTPAVAGCGCDGGALNFDGGCCGYSMCCPQFGNFFNRGCGGCGGCGGGLLGGGCGGRLLSWCDWYRHGWQHSATRVALRRCRSEADLRAG